MDSIMDRKRARDSTYEDIKALHRQARVSGISSFVIGSAATYIVLKITKTFEKKSKYIPLVCLGVGACCGYVKSILVIQKYQNMLQQLEASKNSAISITHSDPLLQTPSKYGDECFFLDEKGSKTK